MCFFIVYACLFCLNAGIVGKRGEASRGGYLLRGVGAGWKTIFTFLLFKIVLKLSSSNWIHTQADCSGTIEWKLPHRLWIKGREGPQQQKIELAPLLHAATVALPPLPSPGGCPFPDVPGKGMAGWTAKCLAPMEASFLISWFRVEVVQVDDVVRVRLSVSLLLCSCCCWCWCCVMWGLTWPKVDPNLI